MLAKMCGVSVNGAWPTHAAPSEPIGEKIFVPEKMYVAMKWQPTPAIASLPSGTRVLVLCGQPEQK